MNTKSMITYAEGLYQAVTHTRCGELYVNEAIEMLVNTIQIVDRVFLVGNGGSGAACDHMANDLCLAKVNAQSLTNSNNITCIANDFGFDQIFAKQLEWLSRGDFHSEDLLIAFSCSGKSQNVLAACQKMKDMQGRVVTFSGMQPDNPLSTAGYMNFYVPSNSYGIVQLAHETLMHCAVDKVAGLY